VILPDLVSGLPWAGFSYLVYKRGGWKKLVFEISTFDSVQIIYVGHVMEGRGRVINTSRAMKAILSLPNISFTTYQVISRKLASRISLVLEPNLPS
jgi:hypothetical protein